MKKYLTYSVLLIFYCCLVNTTYATLTTPTLLTPPNGAMNVTIPVTCTWTTVSGATSYRFQVQDVGSNVKLDTIVPGGGCTIPVGILAGQTQYFWRVKAKSATDSSAFSGYWNFTTAVSAPPPPQPQQPPNGAINVSVTPLIQWSTSPGATSYRLQVSLDSLFGNPSFDFPGLTSNQYQFTIANPLANGTLYFWRVNASNGGGTSGWSTIWHFATAPAPPPPPTLLLPPNGGIGVSLTPLMSWSSVVGATSYHLRISQTSNFGTLIYDTNFFTGTQITVPAGILSGNQLYYWTVSSINAGGEGTSQAPFHFTTQVGPPPAPVLLLPANGATCVSRFPLLDWSDSPTATSYTLQISTDSTFSTFVLNQSGIATSQFQIVTNILANNTTYFWRVRAVNGSGNGQFSAVFKFTTMPVVPSAPTLLQPPNGATGISLTPTMIWTRGANAAYYRIQICANNTFAQNQLVVDVTNLLDTFYIVPQGALQGNHQYFWRVYSINCTGQNLSTVFNFTTISTISLNLKVYLEGFYNGSTQVPDTVRVYLANSVTHVRVDSSKSVLSATGTDTLSFIHAPNASYYIVITHRNHLETWSSITISFATGSLTSYDFTTASSKAFGNNMKQVGSAWVLYGGDINQDGTIDNDDYTVYKSQFGRDGYIPSDLNGDNFADGYDLPVLYSNYFVSKITP